ncbi:MAG: hypothetical protein IPM64_03485 [Phycisphaerales bacterium]|nr:hypothetical protein [Phycisphaerales bacterium]
MLRNTLRSNRLSAACGLLIGISAAATAAPVLEVRVDNVVQQNNATVTLQGVRAGETSPRIIVLRSIGDQNLNFTSTPPVVLFGGDDFLFTLIQPVLEEGNKLSPNGSTAFRVDFAPPAGANGVAPGRKSTRVFIFTNATPTVFALTLEAELLPEPDAAPPPDENPIDEAPDADDAAGEEQEDGGAADDGAQIDEDQQADDAAIDEAQIDDAADEEIEEGAFDEDAFDDDDNGNVKFAAPCGFGIGFGLVGSLVSLGGLRRRRSR